jgi:hypothetical protein
MSGGGGGGGGGVIDTGTGEDWNMGGGGDYYDAGYDPGYSDLY